MALENAFMLHQPAGPKAGPAAPSGPTTTSTDAPAAGAASSPSPMGGMWMIALPLVMVVVMLFSNRNQRKKDAEVRSKLKKGDRVVSQSGLIGELVDMDERLAKVKIAPGTNVQMLISSVSPYEAVGAKTDDKALKDLKDAKAITEKKA